MAAMTPDDDRATELKWARLEELREQQEKLYMSINEIKSKLLDITSIKFDDKVWTELVSLKELAGILSEEEAKLCLDVDAFIIRQLPAASSSHLVVSIYKNKDTSIQSKAISRLPFLGADKMISPCRMLFTPVSEYHELEKSKHSALLTQKQSAEASNIASSSRGQKDLGKRQEFLGPLKLPKASNIASSSPATMTPVCSRYHESKRLAVIRQFPDGSNKAPLCGKEVTPVRGFHDPGNPPAF